MIRITQFPNWWFTIQFYSHHPWAVLILVNTKASALILLGNTLIIALDMSKNKSPTPVFFENLHLIQSRPLLLEDESSRKTEWVAGDMNRAVQRFMRFQKCKQFSKLNKNKYLFSFWRIWNKRESKMEMILKQKKKYLLHQPKRPLKIFCLLFHRNHLKIPVNMNTNMTLFDLYFQSLDTYKLWVINYES